MSEIVRERSVDSSAETNLDQEKNPHSFVREIYCEPLVLKDYNGIDGKIGTNKRENEFISRNAGEKNPFQLCQSCSIQSYGPL